MSRSAAKKIAGVPADKLEAAVAAAAEAERAMREAQVAFVEKYPEDHRVIALKAHWEPERVEFYADQQAVLGLAEAASGAHRAVEQLRAQITAAATEKDRRAALRVSIERLGAARLDADKHRDSASRAAAAVAAAETAKRAVERALAEAQEARNKLFEAAIEQGYPPSRDASVTDARRAVEDATDQLAAAQKASAALSAKSAIAEEALKEAVAAVTRCARSVTSSALPELLQQAHELQAELEARRAVLRFLDDAPGEGASDVDAFLSAEVFPSEQRQVDAYLEHPAIETWIAAIEALRESADVPLPHQARED